MSCVAVHICGLIKNGDFLPLFNVKSPNFNTSLSTIKSINSCLYASIVSKTSCICGFALLLLYWVYSNIKLYWFQCVFALSTGSALLSENYFKSVKYYRPFVLCYNIYNHFKLKNPCICIITNAWITFILASENNKVLFRFIHNRFFYFLLLILSLLLKLT